VSSVALASIGPSWSPSPGGVSSIGAVNGAAPHTPPPTLLDVVVAPPTPLVDVVAEPPPLEAASPSSVRAPHAASPRQVIKTGSRLTARSYAGSVVVLRRPAATRVAERSASAVEGKTRRQTDHFETEATNASVVLVDRVRLPGEDRKHLRRRRLERVSLKVDGAEEGSCRQRVTVRVERAMQLQRAGDSAAALQGARRR